MLIVVVGIWGGGETLSTQTQQKSLGTSSEEQQPMMQAGRERPRPQRCCVVIDPLLFLHPHCSLQPQVLVSQTLLRATPKVGCRGYKNNGSLPALRTSYDVIGNVSLLVSYSTSGDLTSCDFLASCDLLTSWDIVLEHPAVGYCARKEEGALYRGRRAKSVKDSLLQASSRLEYR